MNTLAAVPKNGTLSKTNLNDNFSQLSQLLDGFFNREMPSTFTSNFNTGMSVPKVNIKENPDEFIVEMRHITKRFPGIVANDDVSISVKKGEIFALLGENGAGKSTLMSMLFGMYEPDEGEI